MIPHPPVAPSRRRRPRLPAVSETGGAALLLGGTVVALVWANAPLSGSYADVWGTHLRLGVPGATVDEDLRHWVTDGLMALFFFVVGLEIRRELALGELRDRRAAAVPALAAVAGMAVPALVFTAIDAGGAGARGWGVVMATDIAFVLGALALLGPRIPPGVRVFLLTLAIVDDIGAIVVIAVFYASGIDLVALGVAAAILVAIVVAQRLGPPWGGPAFAVAGLALWVATQRSGIHPTIAGVAMGLVVPVRTSGPGDDAGAAPNARFRAAIEPWTAAVVVPLFALANAGVALGDGALGRALTSPVTIGVVAGLLAGKALGIGIATTIAVRSGVGPLPSGMAARHVPGAATLAGIGFTVSLFVADLAFDSPALRDEAKVGVLVASVLAAVAGAVLLARARNPGAAPDGRVPPEPT